MTIGTTTSGATIRYTTDGSTPTETAGTVYSSPVNITAGCTLEAIAYKSGYTDSTVASGTYTISSGSVTYTTEHHHPGQLVVLRRRLRLWQPGLRAMCVEFRFVGRGESHRQLRAECDAQR